MKQDKTFFHSVCALAVPVALQSMLQASFSIVDQIMIGQLGSVSIAGVGLIVKFTMFYSVLLSAIGGVAGILISQYLGREDLPAVRRSFWVNLALGLGFTALFTGMCLFFSEPIMGLYTKDPATRHAAAEYLTVISIGFFPSTCTTMLATIFRCMEKARLPLYAGIVSAVLNTGLNYVFIFGKCGLPAMGAMGAGLATVISQFASFLIMLFLLPRCGIRLRDKTDRSHPVPFAWKQYFAILLPMLVCELLWSLGENIYAVIYGHLGTLSTAAMTLTYPVQNLVIGALCGLAQAAGVIVGKRLGSGDYDSAYDAAKKLIQYGAIGSVFLSVLVVLGSGSYVEIYQVEPVVKQLTRQILFVYALVAPFKVLNMIIGSGVLRSGGKTRLALIIDVIGTWGFGVPLGLFSAFVLELSIPLVYFLLSLEEVIRCAISLRVFHKRIWIQQVH